MPDSHINTVCDEFTTLWDSGQTPDIAEFLERVDSSRQAELLAPLLNIELSRTQIDSELLSKDEYHKRFPEHTDIVEAAFRNYQRDQTTADMTANDLLVADNGDDLEETRVKHSGSTEETRLESKQTPDAQTATDLLASDRNQSFKETQIEHSGSTEVTRQEQTAVSGRRSSISPEHGDTSSLSECHPSISDVTWRRRDVTFGRTTDQPDAEYEIGRLLGQGGMGAVYQARQCSVDRMVAMKVVKEKPTGSRSGPNTKFLAEALITGALEHPNIVPIYELGANSGGEMFYTMKEVRGVPWRATIDEVSLEDNLDVLIRVADAVRFAHSRGVIHRDLKPDNIMIGEFGEVIVMDWGLAVPTDNFEKSDVSVSLGPLGPAGTPAYMSPEMAVGPWDLIGPASDIYLLGAMLFRAATGRPLRNRKSSSSVMKAVAGNVIEWPDEVDLAQQELLDIARQAMATQPGDRYASVADFQNAVRGYRSHSESRRLATHALQELEQACTNDDYRTYERGLAGLEEALRLWPGNPVADRSLIDARHSYAQSAFRLGDLELAEGQLDTNEPRHSELLDRIRTARLERDRQAGRIQRMKRIAAGLAAAIFFTVSVSALLINVARQHEATARSEAVERFRDSQAAVAELSQLADALGDYPYAQQERQQLLEAVAAYYGRLTEQQSAVPELQYEQLQSLVRLGTLSTQTANYDRARQVYQQVRQQANTMSAAGATWGGQSTAACRQQLQVETFRARLGLASLNLQTGRPQTTVDDTASVITELGTLPQTDVVRREQANAWFEHGMATRELGDYAVAVNSFTQAVEVLGDDSADDFLVRQATSRSMIGQVCEMTGDYEQAATSIAAAIALWEQLEQKADGKIDYLDGLATSRIDRGNLLRVAGLDPLDDYSHAVDCFTRLIEHRPGIPRYRNNLATALLGRAWRHLRMGNTEQSLQDAEESVNAFWSIVERYPDNAQFALGEVAARTMLARVLRDRGKVVQAGEQLNETLEILLSMNTDDFPQGHGLPVFHERYGELLLLLGQVSHRLGDSEQAAAFLSEASNQLKTLSELPSGLPRQKDKLAWVHYHQSRLQAAAGETENAIQSSLQAIQIRNSLPDQAQWLENRAWLLLYTPIESHRDINTAEAAALKAVQAVPDNARFRRTAAIAQLRSGKVSEAAQTLSLPAETRPDEHPEQLLLRSMLAARGNHLEQSLKLLDMARTQMEQLAPENPRLLLIRREAESPPAAVAPARQTLPDVPAGKNG